jgi:hypothetical protein
MKAMCHRHAMADGNNVRFVGSIAKRVLVIADKRVPSLRWVTGKNKRWE